MGCLSSSPTHKPDPILSNFKHPSDRALPKRDQVKKMQFNGPTFSRPPVVPERRYPPGVLVERELRVWAISRWRGSVELTRAFLRAGYAHLPRGSPRMFTLNEVRDRGGILLLLTVTFTNPFDARELLGQVFWCGCEAIFFTIYNIYTNYERIFPAAPAAFSLLSNVISGQIRHRLNIRAEVDLEI